MSARRDPRFFALIDKATEGDEAAIHELWAVYAYDFAAGGDPRNRLPTRKSDRNQNQKEER